VALHDNLVKTQCLQDLTLLDLRLASHIWQKLGEGLGKNESVKHLSLVTCNLGQSKNLYELSEGLKHNTSIQKLTLHDNQLGDEQGLNLLNMIKFMADKRDKA